MQHVLRAISGPRAGAVYVLGERTVIGRASDCDIQILHEGVSRHHARVTCGPDGTVVLADLSSDNGTFVEGERVERHELGAGEVIRVMRSRFVYEVDDAGAVTSEAFRRKVTSGDSLRQTVPQQRGISATRARITQGLEGMVGEHMRAHSRPQAAAPAPSGARPGAPPPTTPPRGDEPGSIGRERWPQPGRAASATRESPPPPMMSPGRTTSPRKRTPAAMRSLGSDDHVIGSASQGTYFEGRGRRDRITVVPTTMLQATGAASSAARVGRNHVPASLRSPSGRMAPIAPASVEVAPTESAETTAGASAGGWARAPSPRIAPGGMRPDMRPGDMRPGDMRPGDMRPGDMRPGSTLTGVPRIDDGPAPAAMQPDTDAPRPLRKSITAEYGAAGAAGAEPAATPAAAAAPEPELDAMKTVPSLRRAKARGSSTPTEEVPRIDDTTEPDARTRPRITRSPRWTRHPVSPIAYEDTLRLPLDDNEASSSADARLDAASTGSWPEASDDPSEIDEIEVRAQELLEHADREHRRHEGLERLAEIVEYRELRLRVLQGQEPEPTTVERCAALERRLQQQPPAGDDMAAMRRYHRFECSVPALLVPPQGALAGPTTVEIEDVSAGGAKITFGECSLVAGDEVSLTVELANVDHIQRSGPVADSAAGHSAHAVVLEARVVWAQPHDAALGIVFVGAPRYDDLDSAPRSPI